jgi:DNA polymerase III epsilon subunit-like protein
MIIFDTETTNLLGNSALPTDQQPRIIEWAGMLVDDETLEEKMTLSFFVNPGILIPPEVTKSTGITQDMVKDQPKFPAQYNRLVAFWLGERTGIAHNAQFDFGLLEVELTRIGRLTRFPWPAERRCTVELTSHLGLKDRKLTTLYEALFGAKPNQTHRALDDVRLLHKVIIELRKRGVL